MTHHTLFISDTHLQARTPEITQLFLNFLADRATKADALYILGDLFEVWVGDDDVNTFNQTIINAIKTLVTKKTPVYLMPGNRDFLLGKQFTKASACNLLPDPIKISLYGKKILLTHGDSLCTQDHRHLRFQKATRHSWLSRWFLKLPIKMRKFIAEKIRHISMKRIQHLPSELMDVTQTAVTKAMQTHNTELLIHGHTHKSGIHQITIDNAKHTRIALDAWHTQGNALQFNDDSNYKLIWFEK